MITLITNATVWTGRPEAAGIAVDDAVAFDEHGIIALGDAARGVDADVIVDAAGGFVCHAFGDGHAHPLFGGLESQFAPVRGHTTPEEIAAAVGAWAAAHPQAEWIRGEGFDSTLAPSAVFHAAWLDAHVPDRPVVLRATDYHTVWVNSAALERVGYGRGVAQPHDGEIVVDESGDPVGTLREWGAWLPVYRLLPPVDATTRREAIRTASRVMASSGIAWVQDAWVEQADVDGWITAAASGDLGFRVDLGLWSDPNTWRAQLDGFADSRRKVQQAGSPLLTCNTVKFFADGVIESGTGALLEPYCDCPHSKGLPNWAPDELIAAVCAVDAMGFNPHIHAIGDAAARMALDAIEAAIATNPPRERRPVIAHAQLVAQADLERFAALGVTANFEPYWAKRDDLMTVLTEPRLGPDRTAQQYRIRTLLDLGARVSFGSDWPVTTVVPVEGVQVAVTRMAGPDDAPFIPEERVSVEEALLAYTRGVAVQRGDDGGMLTTGAPADVVLLDADPRAVDPLTIRTIGVRGTWVGGIRTWDAERPD